MATRLTQEHDNEDASEDPTEFYEAQIMKGVADPHPYKRLMIAYRKTKQFKDELRVINRAIAVFEGQFQSNQLQTMKGSPKLARIKALSKSISKSTGLTDKKGKVVHVPEPIAGWLARKIIVEKKLKA